MFKQLIFTLTILITLCYGQTLTVYSFDSGYGKATYNVSLIDVATGNTIKQFPVVSPIPVAIFNDINNTNDMLVFSRGAKVWELATLNGQSLVKLEAFVSGPYFLDFFTYAPAFHAAYNSVVMLVNGKSDFGVLTLDFNSRKPLYHVLPIDNNKFVSGSACLNGDTYYVSYFNKEVDQYLVAYSLLSKNYTAHYKVVNGGEDFFQQMFTYQNDLFATAYSNDSVIIYNLELNPSTHQATASQVLSLPNTNWYFSNNVLFNQQYVLLFTQLEEQDNTTMTITTFDLSIQKVTSSIDTTNINWNMKGQPFVSHILIQ